MEGGVLLGANDLWAVSGDQGQVQLYNVTY